MGIGIDSELRALLADPNLGPQQRRDRANDITLRPLRNFINGGIGLYEVDAQTRTATEAVKAAGLGPKLVLQVLAEEEAARTSK